MDAFEFWGWWDKDLEELLAARDARKLAISACCTKFITSNIDKIGHFHAAGNPGRHELTRGEIHYPSVFEATQESGYAGYVGLEYWPVDDPIIGLREVAGWFA